jgi:hypothetical protein
LTRSLPFSPKKQEFIQKNMMEFAHDVLKDVSYNTTDFSKTDSLINNEESYNQGWIYLIN